MSTAARITNAGISATLFSTAQASIQAARASANQTTQVAAPQALLPTSLVSPANANDNRAAQSVTFTAQAQILSASAAAQPSEAFAFGGKDTASVIADYVSQAVSATALYSVDGKRGDAGFGVSLDDINTSTDKLRGQYDVLSQNYNDVTDQNTLLDKVLSYGGDSQNK